MSTNARIIGEITAENVSSIFTEEQKRVLTTKDLTSPLWPFMNWGSHEFFLQNGLMVYSDDHGKIILTEKGHLARELLLGLASDK